MEAVGDIERPLLHFLEQEGSPQWSILLIRCLKSRDNVCISVLPQTGVVASDFCVFRQPGPVGMLTAVRVVPPQWWVARV